jgi:hypothetical protein
VFENSGSKRSKSGPWGGSPGMSARSKSYGSMNVKLHVHIISSSIRCRKSANESKKNPRMGKVLTLPTLIRGRTRLSRTPGPSEGFRKQDRVYCLEYRGSMKSLLRRKPPMVPFLFPRLRLGMHNHPSTMKPQTGFLHPFLDPFLPLNQTIARRPPS